MLQINESVADAVRIYSRKLESIGITIEVAQRQNRSGFKKVVCCDQMLLLRPLAQDMISIKRPIVLAASLVGM